MRLTQPGPKGVPALRRDVALLHVVLKVLGAHPARVQLGEQAHEALQVRLFPGRRRGRVGRRDGVEEGPCAPAEGLDVGGAVPWWWGFRGRGFEVAFGLGGPGREGGAGSAAGIVPELVKVSVEAVCVYGLNVRLAVLPEDDAFGELLWWLSGGCARRCTVCGGCAPGLRFCAIGCHWVRWYIARILEKVTLASSSRDKNSVRDPEHDQHLEFGGQLGIPTVLGNQMDKDGGNFPVSIRVWNRPLTPSSGPSLAFGTFPSRLVSVLLLQSRSPSLLELKRLFSRESCRMCSCLMLGLLSPLKCFVHPPDFGLQVD